MADGDDERTCLIKYLYNQQLPVNDILRVMRDHGYEMSRRHLNRLLAYNNLGRRQYSSEGTVVDFIYETLQGSGNLHGYRWMHERCLSNGIRCRKEDVRLILAALGPHGVQQRQSRRLQRRQYAAAQPLVLITSGT